VQKGDVVAIWGAGPIGQMAADFAFINGASRVIMIDSNCRPFFPMSDGFLFFSRDKVPPYFKTIGIKQLLTSR
jgi:hypothetical protein